MLYLEVDVTRQVLTVYDHHDDVMHEYRVPTAKNGVGELNGSECTPQGLHRIRAKIGDGRAINSVFVGRRPTGEIYDLSLANKYPNRDWILTRILWLCGEEKGRNRGANVDTMRRFIYIHGAPDSHVMGVPSSHGCIKMNNKDMIQLFDSVEVGCKLTIK